MPGESANEASYSRTRAGGRSLPEQGKRIQQEVRELASTVQQAVAQFEDSLRESMRDRPYATLAIAAGAGYVLGGGVATRLTRVLLGMAERMAIAMVVQEVSNRIGLAAGLTSKSSDTQH